MSLTGIFRAKDGIAALVDSKASIEYSKGSSEEYIGRDANKLHPFPNGVAVVYGALQIFTENKASLFARQTPIEQVIQDYIARKNTLDAFFFQDLLQQMNTSPLNQEPVRFIVGRKIWTGKYQIEYHKVGYDYYAMKIASEKEHCFVGGSEVYVEAFKQMDLTGKIQSVEAMRKFTAEKLQEMIDFYDRTLAYNPVGGIIKSYIVK